MRVMGLKGKVPLLLTGALLVTMTWLGYWIGYMTYKNHINKLQDQLDRLVPAVTHPHDPHIIPGRIHNEITQSHNMRNSGGRKGPNSVVFGRHGKLHEEKHHRDVPGPIQRNVDKNHGQINENNPHLNSVIRQENKLDALPLPGSRDVLPSKTNTDKQGVNQVRGPPVNNESNLQSLSNKDIVHKRVSPDGPSGKQSKGLVGKSGVSDTLQRGKNVSAQYENDLKREDLDPAAVEEFKTLRQRLRAKIPSEQTTFKPTVPRASALLDPFRNEVPVDTFGKYYALIHSGDATRVHGELHANLRAIPSTVPTESYIFKSKELPRNPRFRPSVANGQLGTGIHCAEVFMNGVYNGYLNDSHRAIIPSTVSFNITGTEPATNFTRIYVLNTGEGVYSEETVSETYTLTQRIYAHRRYSRLLVVEVDLVRQSLRTPLKLNVKLNRWRASPDITFLTHDSGIPEVSHKSGVINAKETDDSERTEVHVFYDHVPNELVPVRGAMRTKWVFLTAIAHTKKEALNAYKEGARLVKSNDDLYAEHVRAWGSVWAAGRVDVVGNVGLAQTIYGAFYYLLSSMPLSSDRTSPFIGLSPSGLPFGDFKKDYQGHVFWDQETWMLPAILPLWPSLGRLLLTTRRRTMKAAAENAKLNKHQGMQFPWESAKTGIEVCPEDVYSKREIHISGDISHAILRYMYATNDTTILQEDQKFGYILTGIAYFYTSVLKWNDTRGFYEIKGVMPPDEYHKNVNNSVYTNSIAKIALEAPEIVFKRANKTVDHFKQVAKEIYIPYSISRKYHPEYDGYVEGTKVKQADAILLGYPLSVEMDATARRNDLKKYEKVTDIAGPAMSWSMFAIGWLELGDEARAESMFKRSFTYIKNDFKVWHETVFGKGATNFITGMGGFLQSVLYGYGGLRYRPDRLDLNPILPLDCTELHLTGLNYLGASLNMFVEKDSIVVNLVSRSDRTPSLVLYVYKTEQVHTLERNHPVRIPRQPATITVTSDSAPV